MFYRRRRSPPRRPASEDAPICAICQQEINPASCPNAIAARVAGNVPAIAFNEQLDMTQAPQARQVVTTPCLHCFHRGCMRALINHNVQQTLCPLCNAVLPNPFRAAVMGVPIWPPPPPPVPLAGNQDWRLVWGLTAQQVAPADAVYNDIFGVLEQPLVDEADALTLTRRDLRFWEWSFFGQDRTWIANMLVLMAGGYNPIFRAVAYALEFAPQRDAPNTSDRYAEHFAATGLHSWDAGFRASLPPFIPPAAEEQALFARVAAELPNANAVAQAAAQAVEAYAQTVQAQINFRRFIKYFFYGSGQSFVWIYRILRSVLRFNFTDQEILQIAYNIRRFPNYATQDWMGMAAAAAAAQQAALAQVIAANPLGGGEAPGFVTYGEDGSRQLYYGSVAIAHERGESWHIQT